MKPQNSTEAMVLCRKRNGYDHMLLVDYCHGNQLENHIKKHERSTSSVNRFEREDQHDSIYFLESHRKKYKVEPGALCTFIA